MDWARDRNLNGEEGEKSRGGVCHCCLSQAFVARGAGDWRGLGHGGGKEKDVGNGIGIGIGIG